MIGSTSWRMVLGVTVLGCVLGGLAYGQDRSEKKADLVIEGTVQKITDLRPRELYPNYFATITVTEVRKGSLASETKEDGGDAAESRLRIVEPPEKIAKLGEGQAGTFYLAGPRGGMNDTYTLIRFKQNQVESGEGHAEPGVIKPEMPGGEPPQESKEPVTDDPQLKAVYEHVKELQKKQADVTPHIKHETLKMVKEVKDKTLETAFPGLRFFGLRFPQYPINFIPTPESLSESNLFAVPTKGDPKVTLMTSAKELQEFCAKRLTAPDEASARTAVHAYALLRKEIAQDGFFQFEIKPDRFTVKTRGEEISVKASITVKPGGGNGGSIDMVVEFKGKDHAFSVRDETENMKAGMRPICQSLKLNDPDPTVRAAAEHDLLIMGVNGLDYLRRMVGRTEGVLQERIRDLIRRIEGGEQIPGSQPASN